MAGIQAGMPGDPAVLPRRPRRAGVRKGDEELKQALNWALKKVKDEKKDRAILKTWGLGEGNRAPYTMPRAWRPAGRRPRHGGRGVSEFLPQALRIIVPPIGNYLVALFKDSAPTAIITIPDPASLAVQWLERRLRVGPHARIEVKPTWRDRLRRVPKAAAQGLDGARTRYLPAYFLPRRSAVALWAIMPST